MTRLHPSPKEPHAGDILRYKMRLEDQPTCPEQIWHGIIKHVLVEVYQHSQPRYYLVHSIEHPDCEDELVYPSQVVGYEQPA